MSIEEERLRILQMVADGKVSPEEATALLKALEASQGGGAEMSPGGRERMAGRWLRIHIEESGDSKVNVRLPMRLVDFALQIARRFVPDMDMGKVETALTEAMQGAEVGKIVEMHDMEDGDRVEIWIE